MNLKESREKMKEIWIAAMLIQVSAAQNINIIGGKVFFKSRSYTTKLSVCFKNKLYRKIKFLSCQNCENIPNRHNFTINQNHSSNTNK